MIGMIIHNYKTIFEQYYEHI